MDKKKPVDQEINSNLLLKILCHDLGNAVLISQSIISRWKNSFLIKIPIKKTYG